MKKFTTLVLMTVALTACNSAPVSTEDTVAASSETAVASSSQSSDGGAVRITGIVPLDETWNLYTNQQLGFSIHLPKSVSVGTSKPPAEVIAFEYPEERMVFLAARHFYPAATPDERQETTLDLLLSQTATDFPPAWAIFVDEARNDAELENALKSTFGPGCSVGEKKETEQKGTFNITIKGDGKPLDETLCAAGMSNPFIRYSTTAQRVVYWGLTQGVQFVEGENEGSQAYDIAMTNSFRFE